MNVAVATTARTSIASCPNSTSRWSQRGRHVWWIVALGGAATLLGCNSAPPHVANEIGISAPDAYEQAKKGSLAIVDIRPDWERARDGRVVGAFVVVFERTPDSPSKFEESVFRLVGGDTMRPIALLCRQGVTSLQARGVLIDAGFAGVYSVKGGMNGDPSDPGWKLWGLPVAP